MSYAELLERRVRQSHERGKDISTDQLHPSLKPFQRQITRWAIAGGRRAIWADTGLGKSRMMIEWCRHSAETTLIAAPLAVCQQTVDEAAKIGVEATYIRSSGQITGPGVYVTNHEMIEHIDPAMIGAVALDEASILKQSTGKTRTKLIEHFKTVPYRTAWTATPGPNDPEELTNQAEFLGQMTRSNMLAAYFVHDSDGWRMKGHAADPMIRWMSTWALAIRKPSDLGDSDEGYILPGLRIIPEVVHAEVQPDEGELFAATIGGVSGRSKVRRETLEARCERTLELVASSHSIGSDSDKLATWDGSQNMPRIGEGNTLTTPPKGIAESLSREPRNKILSTCESTTKKTSTGGSERLSSRLRLTVENESGTPATLNIAKGNSILSEHKTGMRSETAGSGALMESVRLNTTRYSSSRMTDAQYVEPTSEITQGDGTTLTTTTIREQSEESSAPSAISESESSRMTRFSSERLSSTSSITLEPWVLWCGLNDEQKYLKDRLGGLCFSVEGSMSPEEKAELLKRWMDQERPILLTKPSIHGMGINMQHCARTAFVGLSDSYEAYYQAIRRFYRFGQHRVVHAHIVLSELEQQIAHNVTKKERQHNHIIDGMIRHLQATKQEWSTAA